MFKFKNFKILLLLMFFTFAGQDAWAGKYYSYHIIDVKPSGAGKVYSTPKTENGANTNFNACVDPPYQQPWHTGNSTNTLYLLAKANEGYVFSHWEDQNGNTVSSSNPGQVSAHCAQINSESGPGDYNGTYYAVFVPTQAVEVYTENADYGTASINNAQNEVGQTITLTAHENLFQHAFVGWRKESNGQIVSNENPYTFTISEQNKGKYYAVFRDDYNFYRIKNYETNRYMVATNDQGGISNLSSFSLISGLENVIYDAGSIVQVRIHYAETTAHTREYAIIVQGEDTQEITGAYLRMDRVEANELTLWEPNADGIRAKDNGGANVSLGFASSADNTKWIFEKLDLDLNGSSYFSLDPAKLVQVGDKYYTTLRTSWNILIDPERTKPYVVTSVDETAGTFEMEPITGNIIPAGTPVIIETSSKDIEANRMVPTTAAANGAVPEGNLLQTSTKYFPNQSVSASSNYKKLMVNANGQLAFGGNALTTVNGNEAYLPVANEVIRIEKQPLAKIEKDGVKNGKYIVEDQLVVIYADVDKGMLWCKDQGNQSIAKTEKQDGQIDYMREITKEQKKDWDQSNWVMLQFERPAQNSDLENLLKTATGKYIKPASIKGTYSDINNYTITMANQTLQLIDGGEPYVKNLYCPANFLPKNLNINGGEGAEGIYHGEPAHYFFMNPKVQEVCEITYAVWYGDNKFIVPLPTADNPTQNDSQIDGAFTVDWKYNVLGPNPLKLSEGAAYKFYAVVQRTQNSGYLKANEPSLEPSGDFIVYPLNLNPNENDDYNNVITAIDNLQAGKAVTRVVYYNMMGVASDVPHRGINIVVTEYSDGSRTAVKMLR